MFHPQNIGCMGHLAAGPIHDYCEAIQQLLDEHPALREQMKQLEAKAKELLERDRKEWGSELKELALMEKKFKEKLDIHSEKEEEGLFPILGRYIGTEFGPIAVMEYEHSEAKKNLAAFEEKIGLIHDNVTKEEMEVTLIPLITACQILFDHFMKEEKVLFPMAENALSDEEKVELLRIVNNET